MAARGRRIPLGEALDPLVLAVDIGSTASRGDIFDATGRPTGAGKHKIPHAFTVRADGTSEIDPDAVVDEVRQILAALAVDELTGRIKGVALDTFASSLVGVGGDGRALTPCYTYADSRCGDEVTQLRRELDEPTVQQRTGCRLHSSYLAPRLRWLARTQPDLFAAARRWMSLGEYVYLAILGTTAAGTATAAWTGMLDRRTGEWDSDVLGAAGVGVDQLSEIRDPARPIADVDPAVGQRQPALAGAAWFAPIADGLSSNLGVGADDDSAVALAAATSGAMRVLVPGSPELPSGLWCYRIDAQRSLVGGAVNDVGRMVSWLQTNLQLPAEQQDLEQLLLDPPSSSAPLVLPYLSGERSTGWAAAARALITGVSSATTSADLFRGGLEGVSISYARIAEQLREVTGPPSRILASGRVTQDLPSWLRLLADVLGAPVIPVTMKRTTLRGTALHALEVLAPDTPRSAPDTGPTLAPVEEHFRHYLTLGQRYEEAYAGLIARA